MGHSPGTIASYCQWICWSKRHVSDLDWVHWSVIPAISVIRSEFQKWLYSGQWWFLMSHWLSTRYKPPLITTSVLAAELCCFRILPDWVANRDLPPRHEAAMLTATASSKSCISRTTSETRTHGYKSLGWWQNLQVLTNKYIDQPFLGIRCLWFTLQSMWCQWSDYFQIKHDYWPMTKTASAITQSDYLMTKNCMIVLLWYSW